MEDDTCITFPILGEPAPDFEAETTQGPIKTFGPEGKMGGDVLAPGRLHAGMHHRVHGVYEYL